MTQALSTISAVEAAIVAQLQAGVPALSANAGGTVRGVADVQMFIDLTTLEPPAAIVVFDGEKARPDMTIGKATQQTDLYWAIYLVASSFGTDSEGRVTAYNLIDNVVTALEGFAINIPSLISTKMLYVGAARYHVGDEVVIYESRWRHQFLRQEA